MIQKWSFNQAGKNNNILENFIMINKTIIFVNEKESVIK